MIPGPNVRQFQPSFGCHVFQRLWPSLIHSSEIPFVFLLDFVSCFARICYLDQLRELKRATYSNCGLPLASWLLVFCLCKDSATFSEVSSLGLASLSMMGKMLTAKVIVDWSCDSCP